MLYLCHELLELALFGGTLGRFLFDRSSVAQCRAHYWAQALCFASATQLMEDLCQVDVVPSGDRVKRFCSCVRVYSFDPVLQLPQECCSVRAVEAFDVVHDLDGLFMPLRPQYSFSIVRGGVAGETRVNTRELA